MNLSFIPLGMLALPLLGCLAIAFGSAPRRTALLFTAANLLLCLFAVLKFMPSFPGLQFEFNTPWMGAEFFKINFHFGIDGLNLPLVVLTHLVSLAAVGISIENIQRAREFFICLLLISLGALGAFLSFDLFFLYIFHEVALIPTFLMIGIWGNQDRKYVASQVTLYLAAGSLVLLVGLLAFYKALPAGMGSFDLVNIQNSLHLAPITASSQALPFILLLVGFGILISLWPFHSWAPRGYASAPVPVAMMHAGVLKKFGLYGLLRVAVPFLPQGMEAWNQVFLFLLACNILYVGLVTLAQKDLGLMLGYSSVMHMGYLFLALAVTSGAVLLKSSHIALTGFLVLMVAHGLSTALLFGLAGEIRRQTGTLQMSDLGGLASKAPCLAVLFLFGAFASIGLPGLANFAGEILIFFSAWQRYPLVTIIALWGVVLSAVYMLRAVRQIFFGETTPAIASVTDLTCCRRWPYFLLIASLLIIGFYPSILIQFIEPTLKYLLAV